MALIPVTAFGNQFTSSEATFLAALADHVYTDGQLIIGNGLTGGVSFNTLTQGTGITITNGHGTITLSASGSGSVVEIVYVIDGGGSTITTGQKGFIEIPFAMTITGWLLAADQVGSVVLDVWRSTYAGFPPNVGNSITGADIPTLSAVQNNRNTAVTLWTTSLAAGDILAFNVNSVATITRVMLSIKATKN